MILIVNILLLFIAVAFTTLLFTPGIAHMIYGALRYGSTYRRLSASFLSFAVAIDIMCNTAYSSMLNDWFIKHGGYHFGKRGETVSSALGKNQCMNTLTLIGEGLAGILNMLQKDHCYISIDDAEFITKFSEPPKKVPLYKTIIAGICSSIILYSLYKLLMLI